MKTSKKEPDFLLHVAWQPKDEVMYVLLLSWGEETQDLLVGWYVNLSGKNPFSLDLVGLMAMQAAIVIQDYINKHRTLHVDDKIIQPFAYNLSALGYFALQLATAAKECASRIRQNKEQDEQMHSETLAFRLTGTHGDQSATEYVDQLGRMATLIVEALS